MAKRIVICVVQLNCSLLLQPFLIRPNLVNSAGFMKNLLPSSAIVYTIFHVAYSGSATSMLGNLPWKEKASFSEALTSCISGSTPSIIC